MRFTVKISYYILIMGDDWTTRQTLIVRIKNRDDEQAWSEFVSYYRSFIRVILKYLNVSENDIEDLAQDVLLKIWKALEKLNFDSERARFRTWMTAVIRNAVIDFQRAKKRKIKTVDSDNPLDAEKFPLDNDEFTQIVDKEWRVHITNMALDNIRSSFSGNAMEVFEMHLNQASIAEIAKSLNLAESSVYKLRKRVEEKLFEEVKRLKLELEF